MLITKEIFEAHVPSAKMPERNTSVHERLTHFFDISAFHLVSEIVSPALASYALSTSFSPPLASASSPPSPRHQPPAHVSTHLPRRLPHRGCRLSKSSSTVCVSRKGGPCLHRPSCASHRSSSARPLCHSSAVSLSRKTTGTWLSSGLSSPMLTSAASSLANSSTISSSVYAPTLSPYPNRNSSTVA